METFGDRLFFLVKQSDYKSEAKFADDVGISKQTVHNIKTGKSDTTVGKAKLMVKLLREHGVDVDYDWLMEGTHKVDKLALENKELRETVRFYKSRLGTIAKPYSNRVNSQQTRLAI